MRPTRNCKCFSWTSLAARKWFGGILGTLTSAAATVVVSATAGVDSSASSNPHPSSDILLGLRRKNRNKNDTKNRERKRRSEIEWVLNINRDAIRFVGKNCARRRRRRRNQQRRETISRKVQLGADARICCVIPFFFLDSSIASLMRFFFCRSSSLVQFVLKSRAMRWRRIRRCLYLHIRWEYARLSDGTFNLIYNQLWVREADAPPRIHQCHIRHANRDRDNILSPAICIELIAIICKISSKIDERRNAVETKSHLDAMRLSPRCKYSITKLIVSNGRGGGWIRPRINCIPWSPCAWRDH